MGVAFPAWEPHPEVWLLVGLVVVGYWIAIVRLGPSLAPDRERPVSARQLTWFALGVVAMWVASDWALIFSTVRLRRGSAGRTRATV